jgi:hypothetical protein
MNHSFLRTGLTGSLVAGLLALAIAHGAPVPAPQPGDLFAGFRATDGQGTAVTYLVKLGPDTVFRTAAAGSTIQVTGLGDVGADLSVLFGAGWSTRSEVQWGVFGVRTSVNSTVYGSRASAPQGQPTVAWPDLNSTSRNGVAGAITSVLEEVGGYKGAEATANSPIATVQTNTAEASSYARQVGTAGTTDFSSLSRWTSIETGFGSGPAAAALDVFRVASNGSSLLGTFSISATGTITFKVVAPASNGDSDGDGFTDTEEVLAGTGPTDGSSFPQARVTLTVDGPRIESPTTANRTYSIEYSESLAGGTWSAVSTHTSGASAAPVDFLDTDPSRRSKGRGYYRIRISS